MLTFDPVVLAVGSTEVAIEAMSWDDAVLSHDRKSVPAAALDSWFDHWFDPDDRRYVPGARFSKVIHSLMVEERRLSVDFGSAPVEALMGLLAMLGTGASRIAISRGFDD